MGQVKIEVMSLPDPFWRISPQHSKTYFFCPKSLLFCWWSKCDECHFFPSSPLQCERTATLVTWGWWPFCPCVLSAFPKTNQLFRFSANITKRHLHHGNPKSSELYFCIVGWRLKKGKCDRIFVQGMAVYLYVIRWPFFEVQGVHFCYVCLV